MNIQELNKWFKNTVDDSIVLTRPQVEDLLLSIDSETEEFKDLEKKLDVINTLSYEIEDYAASISQAAIDLRK